MSFLDDLKKKAEARASQIYDQLNTLDNNRTYQQRTPTNTRSVVGQLTHNGATNTVGNLAVKPFVINPAQMVAETGRMAAADFTNNLAAQRASQMRQAANLHASIPGFIVGQGQNLIQVGRNLPGAVMADIHGFQGKAPTLQEQAALHNGLAALNRTTVGQMVSPAQSVMNSFIPGAKEQSAAAGYDVNGSLAKKFIAEPAMGAAGTYGLLKGGEVAAKKAAPVIEAANKDLVTNQIGAVGKNVKNLDDFAKLEQANQKTIAAADKALAENQKIMAEVDGGPLASLKQEALNHKTAEDFVKSKPVIYHGTNAEFENLNIPKPDGTGGTSGAFLTTNRAEAAQYGGNIKEFTVRPDAKVKEVNVYQSDPQRITDEIYKAREEGYDAIKIKSTNVTKVNSADALQKRVEVQKLLNSPEQKKAVDDLMNSRISIVEYNNLPIRKRIDALNSYLMPDQTVVFKSDAVLSKKQLTDLYNQAHAEAKGNGAAAPPSSNLTLPAAAPAPVGKLSRFANRTVPKSDEVSPALQQMVKEEKVSYDPHTNAGRLAAADKWLKGKSNDKAYIEVIKSFENEKTVNDQHVVNAIQAAKKLDESGKEGDLMKATEIYDNLSRHLSKKGQEVQAASLLSARTPQGLYYSALKTLRNGKVEPTPEMQTALKAYTDKIKTLEPGSEARDYAIKEMQQYVGRQIPAPLLDKMISTWKAGLLTGVKTITGNAVSNGSFRIGHEISKPLAVALDKGIAAFNGGKRSQAMTYRGTLSGAGEGFQKGWEYFKTGIDERSGVTNKFLEGQHGKEINFKNKALNTYVNGVFRNMAAQDRPFYYSQLRTSLNELATVEGKNAGLKGRELKAQVDKTLQNPSIEMFQIAKNEADRSVLAQDTSLSKGIGALRQGINGMEPGVGRTVLKTATETTMPFTGVPSAFVSRVLDFTPVGPFKLAADRLLFKKELNQRDLTNAIAEATTGTATMWLGAQLAKNNMLSGPYPNDPKEQARWKAERITPNSIKVNGRWRSLNYLGPAGMLFNAGARAHEATANGGNALAAVGSAAGGAPKDLTQQSFLQGVSNAVSAVNDPGRYLGNYVNSQAGSVIPTIVNDLGNATDKFQRDRNNPLDAVKSRLPGVRQSLPISNDVFGNKLQAGSNPVERMINPLRPSTEVTGPMFNEINRLQQNNVAVTPTPLVKTQSFDGVKVPLTDAQRKTLQTNVGQNVQSEWNKAMQTSEYKGLSDDGKKKMLDSIYQTVLEGEKRKFQAENQLGQYANDFSGKAQNLSKNALNYMDGTLDLAKFAKEPGSTSSGGSSSYVNVNKSVSSTTKDVLKNYNKMDTTQRSKFFDAAPDNEYKYLQAKFENDTANGTLTKAQAARAKYDLSQAKVGSSYTKETRDLYGLNKTELYSLLTSDAKGSELANQIVAYGDALEAAGLGNNKWRDSKGNVSIAPKARTASSGGRARSGSASMAGQISAIGSLTKKVASAKVGKATFASKGTAPKGIQQYRKTSSGSGPMKVAVAKKQLKLARSTA